MHVICLVSLKISLLPETATGPHASGPLSILAWLMIKDSSVEASKTARTPVSFSANILPPAMTYGPRPKTVLARNGLNWASFPTPIGQWMCDETDP